MGPGTLCRWGECHNRSHIADVVPAHQLPQGHNIPSVPQYATAPIGIPGPAPTIATEYRFHELRQNPYDRGQLIPAGRQLPTVHFHNFPLSDALVGNTRALVGCGTFAWPVHSRTTQKMAIVFCVRPPLALCLR